MVYNQANEVALEEKLFSCRNCGDCCRGYGGTVVTDQDITRIAAHLGTDSTSFIDDFCEFSGAKPVLTQSKDGYCIFWDEICTIHPVKPRMCRDWPFIPCLLIDPRNWHVMASMCPGISKEIPLHLLETVVRKRHPFPL